MNIKHVLSVVGAAVLFAATKSSEGGGRYKVQRHGDGKSHYVTIGQGGAIVTGLAYDAARRIARERNQAARNQL
ncbi:hypothetical protein [Streptomyces sp. NPDC058653]|uniref:hypothetical protein n=1 Tax=Streptomyces sp. NPDC058653 TaxID=3346576 RepID=UPI00364C16EF